MGHMQMNMEFLVKCCFTDWSHASKKWFTQPPIQWASCTISLVVKASLAWSQQSLLYSALRLRIHRALLYLSLYTTMT